MQTGRGHIRLRPDYIVKIPKRGGHGVVVGQVILTAAHCFDYSTDGEMVLGDFFIEEIESRSGKRFKVAPLAVEPCADIAVLGALDDQAFFGEAAAFEHFCKTVRPVPLARGRIKLREPFPVRIYAPRDGTWTSGTAELFDEYGPSLFIEAEKEIKPGASGGPVLNADGELVAIVSNSSVPTVGVKATGVCPRPLCALPVWACRKFLNANQD